MKFEEKIKRCSELLHKFCTDLKSHSNLNYYDSNISSESFFIPLLNLIFDCDLKNANATIKNAVAVDLVDTNKRIAFQITSNDKAEKIHTTLRKYQENELYNQFDRLIIILIKEGKVNNYAKADFTKDIDRKFNFDSSEDIHNISTLLRKLQGISPDKVENSKIYEHIEFQLGTLLDKTHVWTIETAFHEIEENTGGYLNENFFEIDDYYFKKDFEEKFYANSEIYVHGSNKEETLYCILNYIHNKLYSDSKSDKKEVYIFRDKESWELAKGYLKDCVVIPFFEASQIPALKGNINIFICGVESYNKNQIFLRRRTRGFLSEKLQKNKYEYAYNLVQRTNGIYFYLKKELYHGQLESPLWVKDKHIAIITAILVGSWNKSNRDLQVLETISGIEYSELMNYLKKYINIEMPLLVEKNFYDNISYEIAYPEDAFFSIKDDISPELFEQFLDQAKYVLSEKLLCSDLLKNGIIRTLTFIATQNRQFQIKIDKFVCEILSEIKDIKSWAYISIYIDKLCEASPRAVLSRLEKGLNDNSEMIDLFKRNYYLGSGVQNYHHILWCAEKLLGLKELSARAIRWLMELFNCIDKGSLKDNLRSVLLKIYCVWYNSTVLSTNDILYLAEEGLRKYSFFWELIFEELYCPPTTISNNQVFLYREDNTASIEQKGNNFQQESGYYDLIISNINDNFEYWIKIIRLFPRVTNIRLQTSLDKLKNDIELMNDIKREKLQYELRKIIYECRLYSYSQIDNQLIPKIESLCKAISFKDKVYEFLYLTRTEFFPIPFPASESPSLKNKPKRQVILKKEFERFKRLQLDLFHLLKSLDADISEELGSNIAEYYSDGKYDEEILKGMLTIPNISIVISSYIKWCYNNDSKTVLTSALKLIDGYDEGKTLLLSVLRIPMLNQEITTMLDSLSDKDQYKYWKDYFRFYDLTTLELITYGIEKLIKYEIWTKALDMICHFKDSLTIDSMVVYLNQIINQINIYDSTIRSMEVIISQIIISINEKVLNNNYESYPQLFDIEKNLLPIIGWRRAKCMQYYINNYPQLLAKIVKSAFEYDRSTTNDWKLYERIKFCPGEIDGKIDKTVLENWIKEFRACLEEQNQISKFSKILGRLFTFSPVGTDGLKPHEAIRDMIEEYGDNELFQSYLFNTLNGLGLHKLDSDETYNIASEFSDIANKFRVRYPKTAVIYDDLAEFYKSTAFEERKYLENYN